MPGGRPTTYDPVYCDKVIELGKEGKSLAQMCAYFDVSRQTIDNWAAQHLEFLEALNRAKVHMQAKLEEIGFDGLTSRDFNAALWKATMSARFREDYTERRELAGVQGRPIEVEHTTTPRSLARGIAFALAAGQANSTSDEPLAVEEKKD